MRSKTEHYYQMKIDQFAKRFDLTPLTVDVKTLGTCLSSLDVSTNSLSQYKSIWRWYFLTFREHEIHLFETVIGKLKSTRKQERKTVKRHRGVNYELMLAVNKHLLATMNSYRYRPRIYSLVNGIYYAGFRPSEVAKAHWKDKTRTTLIINNAKYMTPETAPERGAVNVKHRGNGKFRELVNTGTSAEDDRIRDLIDLCLTDEKAWPWDIYVKNIERAFRRLMTEMHRLGIISYEDSKIEIYDYRHQYSANLKNNYYDEVGTGLVAAAMGHSSVNTAIRSYAPRQRGHGKSFFRPSKESIEAVNNTSLNRHPNCESDIIETFEVTKNNKPTEREP